MKKAELNDVFDGITRLLANQPNTLVMSNQGSTRGQIYTIHKSTQEQAKRGICGTILFCGTASETIKYLQGYRDCIREIMPQG